MVRSWQRIVLGAFVVALVALAGIAANFALLGLTQDANDPVGKLSPRAVFTSDSGATTVPTIPTTTHDDSDDRHRERPRTHDGDD